MSLESAIFIAEKWPKGSGHAVCPVRDGPAPSPTPAPPAAAPWITDYDGDGTSDIAVFRSSSGLWAAKGVTRTYFGGSTDSPIPGGYRGDGTDCLGIFRGTSGLWAIKGFTRAYFGSASDEPVTR